MHCDPCSLGASAPLPASAQGHQVVGRGVLEPWRELALDQEWESEGEAACRGDRGDNLSCSLP